MDIDVTFHYPAALMALLIEAIPALNRAKIDVIVFFKGAGVGAGILEDLEQRVRTDRQSIGKHEIARTVLTRLNQRGESALRERREVLRRVVEFESFSMCWDNDRDMAMARVAEIRALVNAKDKFTRMSMERDEERRKRHEEAAAKARAIQERQHELEAIKKDFAALFGISDVWKRGRLLESVLNRVFRWYGIALREAFTIRKSEDGSAIEQIDGVVALDGGVYLVEIKWWNTALGPGDVSQHLVRVFNRGQARGIFIANPGYTDAAVITCKESLQRAVFVLATLEEIFHVVDAASDLQTYLRAKVDAAMVEKNPLFVPAIA